MGSITNIDDAERMLNDKCERMLKADQIYTGPACATEEGRAKFKKYCDDKKAFLEQIKEREANRKDVISFLREDLYAVRESLSEWVRTLGRDNQEKYLNGFTIRFATNAHPTGPTHDPEGNPIMKNILGNASYQNSIFGEYKPMTRAVTDNKVPDWIKPRIIAEYKCLFS